MKYPQLVSTRAVNAISDWLVSRLEQLGVEAPQIYTRLLLSLLQSSVQINDPIEFSNLETFFANRKGGNRRHLPCDTDTLKKLNAVQCLKEIVSSEQEIATIENLVDELCDKLKEIEQQSSDIEDDNKLLVATLSVATVSTTSTLHNQQLQHHQHQHHHHHSGQHQHQQQQQGHQHSGNKHHISNSSSSSSFKSYKEEQHKERKEATNCGVTAGAADIETDPKKRYFRAFPALSKEMEDSFRIWRRNAKSLTWPVDRGNTAPVSKSSSSSTISTNFDAGSVTARTSEPKVEHTEATVNQDKVVESLNVSSQSSTAAIGGVKRKSKRRRTQALAKIKTIQNIRKTSANNTAPGSLHTTSGKQQRQSSPTFWDTDFEGCWEMGRDLIKEFIVKQNKQSNHNRNRSTSESAAYNIRQHDITGLDGDIDSEAVGASQAVLPMHEHDEEEKEIAEKSSSSRASSAQIPVVDISFCCDDEYDDTLASISELAADVCCNTARPTNPRRLYQRESSGFGSRELLSAETDEEQQLNFAQFKAKFNSKVEALWKDAEPVAADVVDTDSFSYTSTSSQMPSLPAVAPFKENLKNFWTNYYNHRLDLAKMPTELQTTNTNASLSHESVSLSYNVANAALPVDGNNTSDYYSMPSNLQNFDKSVGGACRDFSGGVGGRNSIETRKTPVGMFLQNTIWSDNSFSGAGDTDESFYYKVWNSNKKLTQLDALRENKLNPIGGTKCQDSVFQFPPYPHLKWSEGINAGPPQIPPPQQQPQIQMQLQPPHLKVNSSNNNKNSSSNNLNVDCTDSSATASVSSTSCSSLSYSHCSATAAAAFNWQTPVLGQSLQADLQSWSTSNPMSLTEMYGGGSGVSATNQAATVEAAKGLQPDAPVPSITLTNHSSTSSGFVEYGLIKNEITPAVKLERAQQQLQYAAQYLRPKERYSDDENLLTSERTHFQPIKCYADGHVFNICSALDIIEYERSASGYLCLESERYLEYMRNDSFLAEEDVSGTASSNPLYAASNCEAASAHANAAEGKQKFGGRRATRNEFVLKFRVRRCEMACQTDDESQLQAAAAAANADAANNALQHSLCLILSGAAKLHGTGLACSDAMEALNKAVAAAAKAAAAAHLPTNSQYSHWLPTAGGIAATSAGSSQFRGELWTADDTMQLEQDQQNGNEAVGEGEDECDNNGDGEDFCGMELEQQWSMHEIRKKCLQKGHGTLNNEQSNSSGNNNNNGADAADDLHTLWGMCAACNNEYKSVPANRLLRDELQMEADEIMSDLKYMQDLYIGHPDESVHGNDDEDDVDDEDLGDDDEGECKFESDEHGGKQMGKEIATVVNAGKRDWQITVGQTAAQNLLLSGCNDDDFELKTQGLKVEDALNIAADKKEVESQSEPQAKEMVQNVDSLIADFLQPQQTDIGHIKNKTKELECPDLLSFSVAVADAEAAKQHLSLSGDSNKADLWCSAVAEPLRRGGEDKFLSQLSWEHTNLAEIWKNNTPPQQETLTTTGDSIDVEEADKNEAAKIYEKNYKNLQTTKMAAQSTFVMPQNHLKHNTNPTNEDEATGSDAAYKRVQQFLVENTGSKLKLGNRKRRHSASQNYFPLEHHQHNVHNVVGKYNNASSNYNDTTSNASSGNKSTNNNMDVAADLNRFNLKLNSSIFADNIDVHKFINTSLLRHALVGNKQAEQHRNRCDLTTDLAANTLAALDADEDASDDMCCGSGAGERDGGAKQTIITCKYWTTFDPMYETLADSDMIDGAAAFSCLIDKNASILKHVTMVTRPLTR